MKEESKRAKTSTGFRENIQPLHDPQQQKKLQEKTKAEAENKNQRSKNKKEITLIGQASNNLPTLVQKMDAQFQMVKAKAGTQTEEIDLAFMNRYVGYQNDKTQVGLLKTTSKLRMLNIKNLDEAQAAYPMKNIQIDRVAGFFVIESESLISSQCLTIVKEDLLLVKTIEKRTENKDEKMNRQNRFRRNQNDYSASTQQEYIENATDSHRQFIVDHCFPFILLTRKGDFTFFATSREERDILVHELNNICQNTNPELQKLSARGDVMHLIDPIEAFNAWNLSVVCGPTPSGIDVFNRSGSKQRAQDVCTQAQIIKAEADYVSYIRDGVRCYISQVLRKELYITDGYLWKESKTKMQLFKGKYRKVFAMINFKKQIIRFKEERSDADFEKGKDIAFQEVLEVNLLDLDVFKGEHKKSLGLYKFKFGIRTMKREFMFFARDALERDIWLESFSKIVEINKLGRTHVNLRTTSTEFYSSALQATPGTNTRPKPGISIKSKIDQVEVYKTATLQVNKTSIKGTVMKAIENLSLFHAQQYHKRFFMLEFGQPYCYFYEQEQNTSAHRSHLQVSLIGCTVLEDKEVEARVQQKENERSKSILRRIMKEEITRCSWNFPFKLTFTDKEYELYAPSRSDREKWIHILGTIAEMNNRGVKLESMTPFDYIGEQERFKQKQIEEAKLTLSARQKIQQIELEKQIFEQVHLWLKLNQYEMMNYTPQILPIKTQNFVLSAQDVRGNCVLITRSLTSISATQEIDNPDNGSIRLTNIELYLNMKMQTLLVQKIGVVGVSKYTFNEISLAEVTNFAIDNADFKKNKADPSFKHCFKIQVKNNPQKIIACSSEEERNQWIRCLQLIIQMKNLGIDAGSINIFTFEQFRQHQLKLAAEQYGLEDNASQVVLPINAPNLNPNEDSQEEEKLLGNAANQSMQNSINRTAFRRTVSIDSAMQRVQHFETSTFGMDYRYIEGYLAKEIDSKGILRRTQRHLKYFRIVFTTGKLNIKENKSSSQMRSFELKDLLIASVLRVPTVIIIDKNDGNKILEQHEVQKRYVLDETSKESNWPCTFKIDFVQRSFKLHARTRREMDEWMRIFNIIVKMNKIGFSVTEKNPYLFEEQELNVTQPMNVSVNRISNHLLNETGNINNFLNNSQERVEFGIGEIILENQDADIDNVHTASLNVESLVFNSTGMKNSESLEQRFAKQMGQKNFQTLRTGGALNQDHQSRFSGNREPVRALQTGQGTVVNQNITVQNITIKQMTMMQNGDTHHPQMPTHKQIPTRQQMQGHKGIPNHSPLQNKQPQPMEINPTASYLPMKGHSPMENSYLVGNSMPISKPNNIMDEQSNSLQRSTQQPRPASVEVKADLNTSSLRPQSSQERGRKKKKKKAKHQACITESPNSTTEKELQKQKSDLNTGLVSKQNNLVYRTDAVTNFVGDYQEEVALPMSKRGPKTGENLEKGHNPTENYLTKVKRVLEGNFYEQEQETKVQADCQDEITLLNPISPSVQSKKSSRAELFATKQTNFQEEPKLQQEEKSITAQDVQLVEIDEVSATIDCPKNQKSFESRRSRKKIVDDYFGDDYMRSVQPNNVTVVEEFGVEELSSRQQRPVHRTSQSIGTIDREQALTIKDQEGTQIARRAKKNRSQSKQRDNSDTRISMSKIRFAGSQESLSSLEPARIATSQAPTSHISLKDHFYTSLSGQRTESQMFSPYQESGKVNINTVKEIVSGAFQNDKESANGYQTIKIVGSQAISIPIIAKKKKKVMRIKKKAKEESLDCPDQLFVEKLTQKIEQYSDNKNAEDAPTFKQDGSSRVSSPESKKMYKNDKKSVQQEQSEETKTIDGPLEREENCMSDWE